MPSLFHNQKIILHVDVYIVESKKLIKRLTYIEIYPTRAPIKVKNMKDLLKRCDWKLNTNIQKADLNLQVKGESNWISAD